MGMAPEKIPLDLEEGWSVIEAGITRLKNILEGRDATPFGSDLYIIIYTNIYTLCTQYPRQNYMIELHDKYRVFLEDYVTSKAYKEVKGEVKDVVISLINQERGGKQIDRSLVKNILDIFVEIGLSDMHCYENDFESTFLMFTSRYYSRKASNWFWEKSFTDYMRSAEECLKREKNRVAHYLHYSTEVKLLKQVEEDLLTAYASELFDKEVNGCCAFCLLLRDEKVDDLSRMYRLFNKMTNVLDRISSMFKQYVIAEGTAVVKQAENAARKRKAGKMDANGLLEQIFVRKVIELRDKCLVYMNNCFQNHSLFHKALREAFEVFCNKNIAGSSTAELLASFCDNLLKKGGSEKLSDEAIEEALEKVVKLLVFFHDKDHFAEFYRKKLSKRLLFNRSANDDHERFILTKLKQQCGGQFTSKMEGMLKDLTLARENQAPLGVYLQSNPNVNLDLDFTAVVLTTGFWPSYKSLDFNLPTEMLKCIGVFKEFYATKTKHRRLSWIFSLGNCNIIGLFETKTVELIVSTSQAALLLLFNSSDRLSFSDIVAQLNLSEEDVGRLLHSLSCARYKILTKEPNTKTISSSDVFGFNSKFTDKMRRIKIPLPPVEDKKKKVIEDVDQDRRYHIDATIVRVMKSRKVLSHQQLVTECIEQLSRMFKPDLKAIKKRIEDLITREYLERDKENCDLYRYST